MDETRCLMLLLFAGSRALSDCCLVCKQRELALSIVSNLVDVVIDASYNSMLAMLGVSFIGFQMMLLRVRAASDKLEPVYTFELPFEHNLAGLSELLLRFDSRVAHDALDVFDVHSARFNVSLEQDALPAGACDALGAALFAEALHGEACESGI